MPTSFLELLSYCSLNRCAHRVALLFRIVLQLQKASINVTAAATESSNDHKQQTVVQIAQLWQRLRDACCNLIGKIANIAFVSYPLGTLGIM